MKKTILTSLLLIMVLGGFRPKVAAQSFDPSSSAEAEMAQQDAAEREILAAAEQLRQQQIDLIQPEEPAPQSAQATSENRGSNTLTVGTNCTFSSIQTAVNAASSGDVILVEGKIFTSFAATVDITGGKELDIRGGYDDTCTSITGTRTTLDARGQSRSVIEIKSNSSFTTLANVSLRDFVITGGEDDFDGGGGVQIDVGYAVRIYGSKIANNSSEFGGGIIVNADIGVRGSTESAELTLIGTDVINNTATSAGGGLYCTDDATVNINSASTIGKLTFVTPVIIIDDGNTAPAGGGLYIADGCWVNLNSSVQANQADNGGGAYLTGSNSRLFLHSVSSEIVDNAATDGSGGGVYIAEGSIVSQTQGEISDNTASSNGGGVYLTGQLANYQSYNSSGACDRCVELQDNIAGGSGGAVYVANDASVILRQAYVERNQATFGSAVYNLRPTNAFRNDNDIENVFFGRNTASDSYTVRYFSTDADMIDVTLEGLTFAENIDSSGTLTEIGFNGNYNLTLNGLIIWGSDSQNGFFVTSGAVATINDSLLPAGGPASAGNLVGEDPLFVDPANDDWHIRPNSPAVDLVSDGTLTTDIDDDARPALGAGVQTSFAVADAGADEATGRVGINGALCNYATVSDAISDASAGDTIYISTGLYFDQLNQIDKSLTLAAADLDCTTLAAGPTPPLVEISGSGNSADSTGGLVQITGSNTVTFTGMTLYAANAAFGGVLYVDSDAKAVLQNSAIREGSASEKGGCARVRGTLEMIGRHSFIRSCTTIGTGDGAGVALDNGTLIMRERSTIGIVTLNRQGGASGNISADLGGGVYAEGDSRIEIWDDSRISQNTASGDGGGVYLNGPSELLIFDNGSVRGNQSSGAGGGVVVTNEASLTIAQTAQVAENTSDGDGGGVYMSDAGSVMTMSGGSIISNTTKASGGGLMLRNGAVASIENDASIVGNSATEINGQGGGAHVVQAGSVLTLQDESSVRGNEARFGGGVYIGGSGEVVMQNSAEVRQNSAPIGGGIYVGGGSLLAFGSSGSDQPLITENTALTGAGLGGGLYTNGAINLYLGDMQVVGNEAEIGGGLFVDAAELTLNNVSVASNGANTGGGMAVRNSATVTVTAEMAPATRADSCSPTALDGERYCSEFFSNSAETGSAIDIDDSRVQIDHSAFVVNHGLSNNVGAVININGLSIVGLDTTLISGSYSHAAAIEVGGLGNPVPLTLRNSTIADNAGWPIQADDDATLAVLHSIIWGNSKGTLIDNAASFTSICTIAQTVDSGQTFDGANDMNSDPLFVGTARGSYFLGAASPAVDICAGGGTIDLENRARPIDGDSIASGQESDAGAFEYDPNTVPTAVRVRDGGVSSAEIAPLLFMLTTLLTLSLLGGLMRGWKFGRS